MTLDITERLERRRRRQRLPGSTEGAKRLFDIYYAPTGGKARDRLLLTLAKEHAEARDPLQRAADLAGKWARGQRVPSAESRRLIREATGIPAGAWDRLVAA